MKRQHGRYNRWKRAGTSYDVRANVDVRANGISIMPTELTLQHAARHQQKHLLNDELAHLEKMIYRNLVEHIL